MKKLEKKAMRELKGGFVSMMLAEFMSRFYKKSNYSLDQWS
jgi:hypothetical protein